MAVPNTTDFSMQDVADFIDPPTSTPTLSQLIGDANNENPSLWDPTHSGSKNSLLNFQNYGGVASNFVITGFTTSDPTNAAGNNGTATISFQGGQSPYTYTVDSTGTPISTTSPVNLTGLSASTTYVVNIYDSNSTQINQSFTLGESNFVFDADWIMVTYEFTDGKDLDTRSRIVTPNIGQTTQSDMIGWAVESKWPDTSSPIIVWGGDNLNTGFESILINMSQFKTSYPNSTSLVADFRCFWFTTVGTNNVVAECTLWQGGTPSKATGAFVWTNSTATNTLVVDSVGLQIPSGIPDGGTKYYTTGYRLATLTYNLSTGSGVLNNADTTTANV